MNPKGNNYISPADAFEANTFDMKYTTFVYGSVEYIQHSLHQIALCRHYGIPIIIKSLLTSAKEPDAHAAAEMGIHTFITALAGARAFRCGGLLSTGEVYSGEWVVILHEMIEYIKQVLKSEDFSEERLMLRDIVEVGPGGTYVDRRSTYELFRKEYWMPRLFEHSNVGQWIELGSKSIRQQAQELARRLIAGHSYAIGAEVKKELDKIYARARRDEALERSLKLRDLARRRRFLHMFEEIKQAVISGNEELAVRQTQALLDQGNDPQKVLKEGLVAGMDVVGARFKAYEMWLPEVILAAKAMKAATALLKPYLEKSGGSMKLGKIVIATVEGDVHDIGKNLVSMMLESAGFDMVDLGVNAKVSAIAEAAVRQKADLVGLSALLTTTMLAMKPAIKAIRGAAAKVKVMVGGSPITLGVGQGGRRRRVCPGRAAGDQPGQGPAGP